MPPMPSRPPIAVDPRVVDTRGDASLSFAPLDRPIEREQPAANPPDLPTPDRASDARSRRRRPRLVVEGGRPAIVAASLASTGGHLGMSEYPVQVSKVQAPPLREETLARDRLLEWLSVKIHRRAVLLVAEAGYGKTTLLADFSRRTRLRVLWFRLDRGDRDWVGFLAHLVAAVRIHVPEFGSATSALLRETAIAAPPMETVLDTFLRELGGLPNEPWALVFDDFHLVDDSSEIRHVLRELVTRGPERASFVFASRREPPIRLARLRALGEVAELSTHDLRFDVAETEQLFRDTYDMRLEPAVLTELNRRTEGWAASLQLVRAALHDRGPAQVRQFVSSLSGAEGHLYEYLAEEVIGELPDALQQFLMRTAVLDTIDLALGPVAGDIDVPTTRALIEDGERHGLFGKGGPNTRHVVRAHPLVRDFLRDRLSRSIGEVGLRAIHLRVARAAESLDWRVASRHFLAAGRQEDTRRVLTSSIETILATGAYAVADELSSSIDGGVGGVTGLVLASRMAQQRASSVEGLELAEKAWAVDPAATSVLLNLASARTLAGDVEGAIEASRALETAKSAHHAEIGTALRRVLETSVSGNLPTAARSMEDLVVVLRARDEPHYLGVGLLNLAHLMCAMAEPTRAREYADEAISILQSTSAGVELVSAQLARAWALAIGRDVAEARLEMKRVLSTPSAGQNREIVNEIAQIEALVGATDQAWPLLERVGPDAFAATDFGEQIVLARALLRVRDGDLSGAKEDVAQFRFGEYQANVAFEARRHLTVGLVSCLLEEPDSDVPIHAGTALARSQGARLWWTYGELLGALSDRGTNPSSVLLRIASDLPVVITMLAEALLPRMGELVPEVFARVVKEAEATPWRWRAVARGGLRSGSSSIRQACARLLSAIGEREDVRILKDSGRTFPGMESRGLSHALARRLAPRVFVDDLGKIRIHAGDRQIEGSEVRRKSLALLCLLLSKPRFASTREEVVDALWPDHDPASAINSLNQTVYFLRRTFEPDFVDDLSPGYVRQDGETIWLDQELVGCRSRACLEIIRGTRAVPTPEEALSLSTEYRGQFALDFSYEDWAAPYRDALHAGYLRVIELAIRTDLDTGHFERGAFLAERALEVDPEVEQVQAALVKLYRLSGAHAAAAEQYAHYAATMQDLGVDPTPFADL